MAGAKYTSIVPQSAGDVLPFNPLTRNRQYLERLTRDISHRLGRTVRLSASPNCYSYAVNAPTFTSPGTSIGNTPILPIVHNPYAASGSGFDERVRAVVAGGTIDGLTFIGKHPQHKPGTYLIGAFLSAKEGCTDDACGDFHFIREHRNADGTVGWSGQSAGLDPSKLDSRGQIIRSPETAHLEVRPGIPYRFIGYFQAPAGGLHPENAFSPNIERHTQEVLRPYAGAPLHAGEVAFAEFRDNTHKIYLPVARNKQGAFAIQDIPPEISEIIPNLRGHDPAKIAPFKAGLMNYHYAGLYSVQMGVVPADSAARSRPAPAHSAP
ncbi:MAG TPA: hypothetical protein VFR09_02455 [Alphaproteobacteria bacterium]|nr:hypothetical protein [Alphaproteobacteria bacterium]